MFFLSGMIKKHVNINRVVYDVLVYLPYTRIVVFVPAKTLNDINVLNCHAYA